MVYLNDLLWILIILFAMIGFFRGAAKELLVGVAVLLSLFFITLLETSVDYVKNTIAIMNDGETLFYMRLIILGFLVVAGYQTSFHGNLPLKQRLSEKDLVEKLLGAFAGAINGFLIFGTIWYWMHQANYPFEAILPPPTDGENARKIQQLLEMLPPNWLEPPTIYFAIAVGLAIILIMFV